MRCSEQLSTWLKRRLSFIGAWRTNQSVTKPAAHQGSPTRACRVLEDGEGYFDILERACLLIEASSLGCYGHLGAWIDQLVALSMWWVAVSGALSLGKTQSSPMLLFSPLLGHQCSVTRRPALRGIGMYCPLGFCTQRVGLAHIANGGSLEYLSKVFPVYLLRLVEL